MKHKLEKYGDKRVKSGFLLLPKVAKKEGDHESRWLENATWEEELDGGRGEAWWAKPTWIDEDVDEDINTNTNALVIVALMVFIGVLCFTLGKVYGYW